MAVALFGPPVQMYAGSTDAGLGLVVLGMAVGVQGCAPQYAPILYNGKLWRVVYTGGSIVNPAQIWMLVSSDSGVTWSVADLAHSPTWSVPQPQAANPGGVVFDGDHSLILAHTTASNTVGGPLQLQNFDLSTGLWGAVYGTAGAPSCTTCSAAYLRSDGSLLVFFDGNLGTQVSAASYNAGIWTAPFACDTNFVAGGTANDDLASVYDPTSGTVHCFLTGFDGSGNHHILYQQVLLSNVLGVFQDFGPADFDTSSGPRANPIIVGENLLWGAEPVSDLYPTLLVGTPLASPVFSLLPSPGIDPQGPGGGASGLYSPYLFSDGSTISAVYVVTSGLGAQEIRVAQTSNLVNPALGWSASTVYSDPTAAAAFSGPSLMLFGRRLGITFEGPPPDFPVTGFNPSTELFMATAMPPFPAAIIIRGVKRVPAPSCQNVAPAPISKRVKQAV